MNSELTYGCDTQPASIINLKDYRSGADFSNDRKYRYRLWRIWNERLPLILFIGLNPSTADENLNDPTIRSCERITKANGFGGFYMMNCWAYIATDPKLLKINPMSNNWNDDLLSVTAFKCKEVVFAWGSFDIVRNMGRDKELLEMFPNAKALQINKNGSPKHPLYCKTDTKLIPYSL
jgi:hypothetical protein